MRGRERERGGVAHRDAMEVTGHKTDSMWHRYNIVDTKRKKATAKVDANGQG